MTQPSKTLTGRYQNNTCYCDWYLPSAVKWMVWDACLTSMIRQEL
jgi:hypothetical protein